MIHLQSMAAYRYQQHARADGMKSTEKLCCRGLSITTDEYAYHHAGNRVPFFISIVITMLQHRLGHEVSLPTARSDGHRRIHRLSCSVASTTIVAPVTDADALSIPRPHSVNPNTCCEVLSLINDPDCGDMKITSGSRSTIARHVYIQGANRPG